MNWQDLAHASLDNIFSWAEGQTWCQAMAHCSQDAQWHAEGDVWTHTKMVCQELFDLEEWPSLSAHERVVLTFAALLHDAAKPLTSALEGETRRIRSPKHAVTGEHLARGILRDLGCDLATREKIACLVRYHNRPAFLFERPEPVHEVVRLSWLVSNRLLLLLALTDTRGRDTDCMDHPEEELFYWKMLSEDNNCYVRPYAFANAHARFLFFRQAEPNLYYVPHEQFSSSVTLMSGLPGSGKDTWLARHRSGLPVVSLDDLRGELDVEPTENQGQVVQLARERCRNYLRTGQSFAFNATNIVRVTRERWITLFADYNARVELVYIEPPVDRLLRQNGSRTNRVPEHVIRKMAGKCEPPTWIEGHELLMTDGEAQ